MNKHKQHKTFKKWRERFATGSNIEIQATTIEPWKTLEFWNLDDWRYTTFKFRLKKK